jgi:hypothetical protein
VKCSETLDGLFYPLPHRPVLDHGRKVSHVLSHRSGTEARQEEPALRFGPSICGPDIASQVGVGREAGNDLTGLKVQESALTPDRISFEHSGYPIQVYGKLPEIVRSTVDHAQPNLLFGKYGHLGAPRGLPRRLPYGRTMAPGRTLLQPDQALPHPARENRSQRLGAHRVSLYGESPAKSHETVQAGMCGRRAVG